MKMASSKSAVSWTAAGTGADDGPCEQDEEHDEAVENAFPAEGRRSEVDEVAA